RAEDELTRTTLAIANDRPAATTGLRVLERTCDHDLRETTLPFAPRLPCHGPFGFHLEGFVHGEVHHPGDVRRHIVGTLSRRSRPARRLLRADRRSWHDPGEPALAGCGRRAGRAAVLLPGHPLLPPPRSGRRRPLPHAEDQLPPG